MHKYSGSEVYPYMPNVLSPEKAIFDFTFLQRKKYIFMFDSITCFHFLSLHERFFVDLFFRFPNKEHSTQGLLGSVFLLIMCHAYDQDMNLSTKTNERC